eukprot:scaffold78790_cov29-Tisochrysis_lutea.AAC.3
MLARAFLPCRRAQLNTKFSTAIWCGSVTATLARRRKRSSGRRARTASVPQADPAYLRRNGPIIGARRSSTASSRRALHRAQRGRRASATPYRGCRACRVEHMCSHGAWRQLVGGTPSPPPATRLAKQAKGTCRGERRARSVARV